MYALLNARPLRAVCLALALLAAGCKSAGNDPTTVLVLRLVAGPGLPPATRLVLAGQGFSLAFDGAFPPQDGSPVRLGIDGIPGGVQALAVDVSAYDGAGCLVGHASATVPLRTGQVNEQPIEVEPAEATCADAAAPTDDDGGSDAGAVDEPPVEPPDDAAAEDVAPVEADAAPAADAPEADVGPAAHPCRCSASIAEAAAARSSATGAAAR